MLQALGVSPRAECAYVELLRGPAVAVAGLAEALTWSVEQTEAALAELSSVDLVRPSWTDPELVRPVPPDVAVPWLVARRESELRIRQREVELTLAAIPLLCERAELRSPAGGDVVLANLDSIRDGLEGLAAMARSEVVSMVPDAVPSSGALRASRPVTCRLLERGVRMRTLYLGSARRQPAAVAHAHWLIQRGAQVRTCPVLPLRMMIFDGARVVVPGSDGTSACVLDNPAAVALAVALFHQQWADAADWSAPAHRATNVNTGERSDRPTGQELALLRLLADGETDERMARMLGVSVRTVGRMTCDLLRTLGARSRFQAGAFAMARGWLDQPEAGRGAQVAPDVQVAPGLQVG